MTDHWRIRVLVENTAGRGGVLGEHGWSACIEADGHRILLDTGQGHVFTGNIRELGFEPAGLDAVVLSHGHYDHTGALATVLAVNRGVPLYAHPGAFEPKFARNPDGTSRDVGMPEAQKAAVETSAAFVPVDGPTTLVGEVHVTGPVPRRTDFEDTGGAFFRDPMCRAVDDLVDDQAVFFDTPVGIVVVLGCAHAGVVNTLRHIRGLTNGRPIHTVIGGMHLVHADTRRLEATVEALREFDVKRLAPCHCTGFPAMARFWREFPAVYTLCRSGTVFEGSPAS